MRALRERVDAGVRSSSAVNAHSSAGEALKRALEMILHRVAMRLALPAGERRAIVSDDQFQSSRHTDKEWCVMSDKRKRLGCGGGQPSPGVRLSLPGRGLR